MYLMLDIPPSPLYKVLLHYIFNNNLPLFLAISHYCVRQMSVKLTKFLFS